MVFAVPASLRTFAARNVYTVCYGNRFSPFATSRGFGTPIARTLTVTARNRPQHRAQHPDNTTQLRYNDPYTCNSTRSSFNHFSFVTALIAKCHPSSVQIAPCGG